MLLPTISTARWASNWAKSPPHTKRHQTKEVTITKFTVHFDARHRSEGKAQVEFEAEYYKRDEGWVTFKTADHKVVCDVPESGIKMIEADGTSAAREPRGPQGPGPYVVNGVLKIEAGDGLHVTGGGLIKSDQDE